MLNIAKTFEFAASHCLAREDWSAEKNKQVYGKCANPAGHGHNYKLEVIVEGPINPDTGMVFDASLLDKIVTDKILSELDHKHLNTEVSWLKSPSGAPPTSEIIVESIWLRLEPEIPKASKGAYLSRLILHETSRIYTERRKQTI
jgi:6-pyruvoyltetrahydropterin/6-carboxytetrahydropterin synthase